MFIKIITFLKTLKIKLTNLYQITFSIAFIGSFLIYVFEKYSYAIKRTFLLNILFTQADSRSVSILSSLSKLKEYKLGVPFGNFFECSPTFDFGLTYIICNIGIFGLILYMVFILLILKHLISYYKKRRIYILFLISSVFLINLFGSESYTISRYSYPLALMLIIQLKFIEDKILISN